jgi:sugar/nucleoside kinase (ribokinase family)
MDHLSCAKKTLTRLRQVVSSDSAMRIGCIGMTTVDTLMFTDRIPSENEDLGRLQQVYQCLGGKGMVTALTLFALGCDVSLLTLIGNKQEIEGFLPRYFDAGYLLKALVGNNRTWIPISIAQGSVLFVFSSPLIQDAHSKVVRNIRSFLENVEILYLSTEYMFVIREATTKASKLNLPLVTNLNAALLSDPECSDPDVVALSRLGLNTWSEISVPNLQEIVITRGAHGGTVALRPFQDWQVYSAHSVEPVVCDVGAGDTFNGGYLRARFVEGKSPYESCAYAARVAGQKLSLASSSLFAGVRTA